MEGKTIRPDAILFVGSYEIPIDSKNIKDHRKHYRSGIAGSIKQIVDRRYYLIPNNPVGTIMFVPSMKIDGWINDNVEYINNHANKNKVFVCGMKMLAYMIYLFKSILNNVKIDYDPEKDENKKKYVRQMMLEETLKDHKMMNDI